MANNILLKIRNDRVAAMKSKDNFTKTILSTLIGEIEIIGKNDRNRETTEAETISVLINFRKGAQETLSFSHDNRKEDILKEIEIYQSYLPAELTDEELEKEISTICDNINAKSIKDMGFIMAALKDKFAGQYDGKKASDISKQILLNKKGL